MLLQAEKTFLKTFREVFEQEMRHSFAMLCTDGLWKKAMRKYDNLLDEDAEWQPKTTSKTTKGLVKVMPGTDHQPKLGLDQHWSSGFGARRRRKSAQIGKLRRVKTKKTFLLARKPFF